MINSIITLTSILFPDHVDRCLYKARKQRRTLPHIFFFNIGSKDCNGINSSLQNSIEAPSIPEVLKD